MFDGTDDAEQHQCLFGRHSDTVNEADWRRGRVGKVLLSRKSIRTFLPGSRVVEGVKGRLMVVGTKLQYVRLHDCESEVVVCSTGAPQGTVLSPFLFTLYTSDFSHNSDSCHLQKFSDDTAIVGRVSEGNELEYREVITNFVAWCELNHLRINTSKTKEVVIDFSRKAPHTAPVNIQGLDIEIVEEYKYLGVHLNNKLDWTHNTDALYKKGQSCLHLLRRLRSFGVCRTLLRTFYDSVVASVIFYAVVCWSCGSSERDRKRLNKLVRRAGSVLDCSLDSIEEVVSFSHAYPNPSPGPEGYRGPTLEPGLGLGLDCKRLVAGPTSKGPGAVWIGKRTNAGALAVRSSVTVMGCIE
ncbi:putative RNA-directed DNA polymerase from transposon BS [Takifugu flavidus]|uniref:Putative RNA-directed DNA polymerase from transposon BS n=1 Tax=Takifugu flavidus TaxID=433684 RepID=A0A5C6PH40_9TELE|nr:putative RNA-directed DNA polymerase from transposon BS [Takifugu flavidus]